MRWIASSFSTLSPCHNVMSTGSDTPSSAATGQSGSDANGVVVVVAFVTGGVVEDSSPGAVLCGGSDSPPPGTVEPGGGLVAGGSATVVAVGVSLPATMIELPEPQAAASEPSRNGRSLTCTPRGLRPRNPIRARLPGGRSVTGTRSLRSLIPVLLGGCARSSLHRS